MPFIAILGILGILAATALPKFLDMRGDAVTASANGVTGNRTLSGTSGTSARVTASVAVNGISAWP